MIAKLAVASRFRLGRATRLSLLLALGLASCRDRPPDLPELHRADLILISIDTLRADRLSIYGNPRPTSPGLAALATDAVVFDRFFNSGGATLPSHATMLTGLNPVTHGLRPDAPKRLEAERQTLAESLLAAGYATAAWTDGGWMRAQFGLDQGFTRFDDSGGGLERTLPLATAWFSARTAAPKFLFLHTYDVHSKADRLPYDCPGSSELEFVETAPSGFDGCRGGRCATELLQHLSEESRAGRSRVADSLSETEIRFVSDLYDGCVAWMDRELSEFFADLRRAGLYDPALIVVTSDHGEQFLEHGEFLHSRGGFEEFARLPLVLKLPAGGPAGRRTSALSAMVDLAPTLLSLLRQPPIPGAQGLDLSPALFDSRGVRTAVHMYNAIRTERWKLFSRSGWLYALDSDPRETRNVFAQEPELVAELTREVGRLLAIDERAAASFLAHRGGPSPLLELSVEEKLRLRALGYTR